MFAVHCLGNIDWGPDGVWGCDSEELSVVPASWEEEVTGQLTLQTQVSDLQGNTRMRP